MVMVLLLEIDPITRGFFATAGLAGESEGVVFRLRVHHMFEDYLVYS
jgi:hypothetical protein